jgi:hypothetical protein
MTKIVSIRTSPTTILTRPWWCCRGRPRCRARQAEVEPTQRDRHLQTIARHGRLAWQKQSGYTKRARAEAAMGRWEQVIGDGRPSTRGRVRARTDQRRTTEAAVGVHALNRMLELGRPDYVRID